MGAALLILILFIITFFKSLFLYLFMKKQSQDTSEIPTKRLNQIKNTLTISIQNATFIIKPTTFPLLIPIINPCFSLESNVVKNHLKWMMQKQSLHQDIYLVSEPGPFSRHLALTYCQLTRQAVEYVMLSRDTIDSDLKQRREIINNSVKYINQQCVNAAIHGRILILDGIQKAERNVLPLLNNLLENREMQLDDNTFLTNSQRYDKLKDSTLLRVSDDFQVIAIGLSTVI
jgi:hypothetical protein